MRDHEAHVWAKEVLSTTFPFQLALVDAGDAEGIKAALAVHSADALEEFVGKNKAAQFRELSLPVRAWDASFSGGGTSWCKWIAHEVLGGGISRNMDRLGSLAPDGHEQSRI